MLPIINLLLVITNLRSHEKENFAWFYLFHFFSTNFEYLFKNNVQTNLKLVKYTITRIIIIITKMNILIMMNLLKDQEFSFIF